MVASFCEASRTPGSAIFGVLAFVLLLVACVIRCHKMIITTVYVTSRFEAGKRGTGQDSHGAFYRKSDTFLEALGRRLLLSHWPDGIM